MLRRKNKKDEITSHNTTTDLMLYSGFEEGVLDWDAIPVLQQLLDSPNVVLTGRQPAKGGVWVWLNEFRFFFSSPSCVRPPLKAEVVSIQVNGYSVEIHLRKKGKHIVWVGDTLRCEPAVNL